MEFPRIDSAVATCLTHLESLKKAEDADIVELESYLVAAVTVLIVSEYETFIEALFGKRGDRCGDPHIANYVRSQLARRFRSPDLGKVTDVLRCFGQDYCKRFFEDIENTQEHAAWDNIMRARHFFVHRQGSMNLTLRELSESYERTKHVMNKLVETLEA